MDFFEKLFSITPEEGAYGALCAILLLLLLLERQRNKNLQEQLIKLSQDVIVTMSDSLNAIKSVQEITADMRDRILDKLIKNEK